MARPPDSLKAAGDGLRRLDLDDEVDGAHVDAELERRRGHERRDLPSLEELLDLDPLLARERPVVSPRDLALCELVQPQRKPLGQPAVVDENDRRAVALHQPQELRIDRRPDRIPLSRLAHVLDRNDHAQVELLGPAGVDQLDLPAARDEAPDLVERPLGRGKADALERLGGEPLQPLEAEREVGTALGPGDGVHLVHDHEADGAERLSRAGGQQEEEGLGGRDEDVRRVPEHRRALFRRGVPGANADRELRANARQGAAEVALDVVVERLERADVEHLDAFAGRRAVEGPEERGERLPRAGRRLDQRVLSRRDRRPAAFLGRRRRVEGLLEPAADGGAERGEGAHRFSVSRG